jgi:hypothetical protein
VRRIEVGEAPWIVVDNRVGRVALSVEGDGAVEVAAEKHAAKDDLARIRLVVAKDGDVVTIRWDANEPVVKGWLDVTVKAPRAATLQLKTGNGAIAIEGFRRGADAKTGVGPITLKGVAGDLALHTGNGTIRVDDADGGIAAETGVGAVEVSGRLAGSCRIRSGNGGIVVALPAGSRLAIDARTGNGAIRNDFALPVEGMVSHRSRGRLGDGSAGSLHLETGVGSIELKAQ